MEDAVLPPVDGLATSDIVNDDVRIVAKRRSMWLLACLRATAVAGLAAFAVSGCGGAEPASSEPTELRRAIGRCVAEAEGLFRSAYDKIPAETKAFLPELGTFTTVLRDFCEQAGIDGVLTTEGMVTSKTYALDLIERQPELAQSLCEATYSAGQPPSEYVSAETIAELGSRFCKVWFSEGYADRQRDAMEDLRMSGVPQEEIAARSFSGEFIDLNELYGDHPELVLPFLIATELDIYDSDFTSAEKADFPRVRYRRFLNEVYERAIRTGLLDLNTDDPDRFYRDQDAFDRLAREIAASY